MSLEAEAQARRMLNGISGGTLAEQRESAANILSESLARVPEEQQEAVRKAVEHVIIAEVDDSGTRETLLAVVG